MWCRRRRRRMYQIPTPTKASKTSAPMMPPTIAPTWGLPFEVSDTGAEEPEVDCEAGGELSVEPSWVETAVVAETVAELLGVLVLGCDVLVSFEKVPFAILIAVSRSNVLGGGVIAAIVRAHGGTVSPEGSVRLGEGVVPQFLSSSVEKSVQFKA